MAFNVRKFKFRVQIRPASKNRPRRVSLVAQRKIAVKGKMVTAGTAVNVGEAGQMKTLIAKPKLKGAKIKPGGAKAAVSGNAKVGGKWKVGTSRGAR